jgi:hypothetical protein
MSTIYLSLWYIKNNIINTPDIVVEHHFSPLYTTIKHLHNVVTHTTPQAQ